LQRAQDASYTERQGKPETLQTMWLLYSMGVLHHIPEENGDLDAFGHCAGALSRVLFLSFFLLYCSFFLFYIVSKQSVL
jgi:hypothetical protein